MSNAPKIQTKETSTKQNNANLLKAIVRKLEELRLAILLATKFSDEEKDIVIKKIDELHSSVKDA